MVANAERMIWQLFHTMRDMDLLVTPYRGINFL